MCAQIWTNLESLAGLASANTVANSVPSDYVLTQLEALGQILSYCLLDAGGGGVSSQPHPTSTASPSHENSIVANLVHVFGGPSRQLPASREQLKSARRSLLSMTPRLVVAVAALWSAVNPATAATGSSSSSWLVGSSKAVRNMILELLSPLATVHPTYFLAAVSVAWAEQEKEGSVGSRKVLVELVSSLRMFPTPKVISTLRQVLRSPPPVTGNIHLSLETASLQFLAAYITPAQLAESWQPLKDLLKDSLALAPPSVFLALEILHQAVVKGVAASLEKRETRDLQEIARTVLYFG